MDDKIGHLCTTPCGYEMVHTESARPSKPHRWRDQTRHTRLRKPRPVPVVSLVSDATTASTLLDRVCSTVVTSAPRERHLEGIR